MALKDMWQDLEDAVAVVENSGSDISVKPINDIAHAVIGIEGLLQTLSEYIKKSEFSTELIKSTNQELKDVEDYTEEERKLPICAKAVMEIVFELAESITANTDNINKIKKQVGDFGAALDAAIALCDSYIGGETE